MLSYSNVSYLRYHQPQTVNGRDSPKMLVMLAAPLLFELWLVSRSYAQDRGNLMSFPVVIFGGIHGVTREGRSRLSFEQQSAQRIPVARRPGFHY